MVVEVSPYRGSVETASKFAEPEANAEIDSLDLKRRQILLYLIDCLGSLRRQEIEKVAAQLAKDNGTESTSSQSELILRPLYDTCLAAGIFENEGHEKKQGFFNLFNALHRQSSRSRHLHDDPVLQLVALCYYPAEMQYTRPREVPASLAEAVRQDRDPLAGEGPARPLIQEIYSLESSGLVRTRILDDKPDGFTVEFRSRRLETPAKPTGSCERRRTEDV
jgi:hypothetical protein